MDRNQLYTLRSKENNPARSAWDEGKAGAHPQAGHFSSPSHAEDTHFSLISQGYGSRALGSQATAHASSRTRQQRSWCVAHREGVWESPRLSPGATLTSDLTLS